MKVLVLTNIFPPDVVGGYELACSWACEAMADNGWEVVVMTSSGYQGSEGRQDIKVHRILLSRLGLLGRRSILPKFAVQLLNSLRIARHVAIEEPDVVFVWNFQGLGGWRALSSKSLRRIPQVHYLMDASLTADDADAISALSRVRAANDLSRLRMTYCSRYLERKLSPPAVDCSVVAPFIASLAEIPGKISYTRANTAGLAGVYIGQVAPHKGVIDLALGISHMHEAQSPGWSLDIFTPASPGIAPLMGLPGITVHVGVPRAEMLSLLHTYEVGYFPSVWEEPFGMAQVELMAAALPVITTARGGSSELATEQNSLIAPGGDVAGVLRAAKYLDRNYDAVASTLGSNARVSCSQNFSKERFLSLMFPAL